MIKEIKKTLSALLFFHTLSLSGVENLAIVVVIDQFSYDMFKKIEPHLQGGIKTMLNNGISYENAHFPYAKTSTGPGHATMSTGVVPKDHGITANKWRNGTGKKIACDFDADEAKTAVFSSSGVYKEGKSAKNVEVDSLSDQIILASKENTAYALSLKSRSAIMSATRLGKAIWFDTKNGSFTSCKAYFDQLPEWLATFNQKINLQNSPKEEPSLHWKSFYPLDHKAYGMVKGNYTATRMKSIINTTINTKTLYADTGKTHKKFDFVSHTPQSNKLLLDLAEHFLKEKMKDEPEKILLWVSLSGLDKIGHIFGPDSLEYIDTLYHIDHYLAKFMENIADYISPSKTTFVVTADHGSTPIVETLQQDNFTLAHRLLTKDILSTINETIEKKYGITSCIQEFDVPSLYINCNKLNTLSKKEKKEVTKTIQKMMSKQPGIKKVWTYQELEKENSSEPLVNYYKNQLYKGRIGEIIYQAKPYTYITDKKAGTGHASCYDYTTHVPLILYKPNATKQTKVGDQVFMTQLAPTLAQTLNISPPSACTSNPLPLSLTPSKEL